MGSRRPVVSDLKFAAGMALLVSAAVTAELALLHMRAISRLGEICGPALVTHCALCPAAAAFFAAGLVLLASARRRSIPTTAEVRTPVLRR